MESSTRLHLATLFLTIITTTFVSPTIRPTSSAPTPADHSYTTNHFDYRGPYDPGMQGIVRNFTNDQIAVGINPEEIMVVFDLDETVMAHHPIYQITSDKIKAIYSDRNHRGTPMQKQLWQRWADVGSILVENHAIAPMHSKMPAWIKQLQQIHGVCTIGLTDAGPGAFGRIPDIPEFRIKQLEQIGISFAKPTTRLYHQRTYKIGDEIFEYRKGVLFSNHITATPLVQRGNRQKVLHSKGLVLHTFLENVVPYQQLKAIIFIDDRIEFIKSVHEAMELYPEINFASIHYTQKTELNALHKCAAISGILQEQSERLMKSIIEEKAWNGEIESNSLDMIIPSQEINLESVCPFTRKRYHQR